MKVDKLPKFMASTVITGTAGIYYYLLNTSTSRRMSNEIWKCKRLEVLLLGV